MNRVLAIGGVVVLVQTFVLVVHFEYSGHFHASRAASATPCTAQQSIRALEEKYRGVERELVGAHAHARELEASVDRLQTAVAQQHAAAAAAPAAQAAAPPPEAQAPDVRRPAAPVAASTERPDRHGRLSRTAGGPEPGRFAGQPPGHGRTR